MARFTLLVALFVGVVCLLDHTRALAHPINAPVPGDASQMPKFPGPEDIPKPPGMLHSRLVRQIPSEIPDQDKFPPPPSPPPQMPQTRSRRSSRTSIEMAHSSLPAYDTTKSLGAREKRSPKGTGGKLPSKSG
ncbi:uncharacterized protein LOC128720339 [Anopheles nili]|uniref:uncharacterized protein LOC128720339 n=1 Tax=Anopheles nili TaxID=185578 RepID=UPI00237BAA65|nr:uncharacterized protein LOC128720339 [Anopheles nili]